MFTRGFLGVDPQPNHALFSHCSVKNSLGGSRHWWLRYYPSVAAVEGKSPNIVDLGEKDGLGLSTRSPSSALVPFLFWGRVPLLK